jgi:taurine dioxygenase
MHKGSGFMQVETIDGSIGCRISGVSLVNSSAGDVKELLRLMYQHKIVVIRDQQPNEAEFCEFSRHLGEPVPYLQTNYHHPEFPLIFVSSNVKRQGRDFGVARTGGYWHSDTAFLAEPVVLTLLYPQVIPKNTRRTTLFIDLEHAYRELPAGLRNRIQGRTLIHSGKWRYKVRAEDAGHDLTEILATIDRVQPPAKHPAVIRHPVTNAEVLYATRGFTVGVEGLGLDDSAALLGELFDFVEQPRFQHEFQWRPGDIILWDNRFLAHKAGRLGADEGIPVEEDTLVYRIILHDGMPLSADQAADRANAHAAQ